jgi:hypothetical protein
MEWCRREGVQGVWMPYQRSAGGEGRRHQRLEAEVMVELLIEKKEVEG